MIKGKTMAAQTPAFRFPPNALATIPTTVGPEEHPTSPASAIRAYIAVPPPRSRPDAMLKVPGQKMPTENPQNAHPASPIIACPEKTAMT